MVNEIIIVVCLLPTVMALLVQLFWWAEAFVNDAEKSKSILNTWMLHLMVGRFLTAGAMLENKYERENPLVIVAYILFNLLLSVIAAFIICMLLHHTAILIIILTAGGVICFVTGLLLFIRWTKRITKKLTSLSEK